MSPAVTRRTRAFSRRAVFARFQSAGRVTFAFDRGKTLTRRVVARARIPFLFPFYFHSLLLLLPFSSPCPSPPLLSTLSFPCRRRRDRPPAWKNTRRERARTPGKQSRDRDVNSRMSCTRSRGQNTRRASAFIVHSSYVPSDMCIRVGPGGTRGTPYDSGVFDVCGEV